MIVIVVLSILWMWCLVVVWQNGMVHHHHHLSCFFTINYVGFCQCTNRQRANHTVSEERGRDYRDMASSQGVLGEGEKREKEGGC